MGFSFVSGLRMARKKAKKDSKAKKPKKAGSKTKKKQAKGKGGSKKASDKAGDDMGIIVIEDDLEIDKKAELEARKAYLEEARSQEAFD